MKKILLFIAAGMLAVSCSDDDNKKSSQNIDASLLIGKWDLQTLTNNNVNVPINDCDFGTWKEFKSNGQLVEEYNCNGTIDLDTSTYTISGSRITNTVAGDPDSPYVFDVQELSEDILIMSFDYEDEDGNNRTNKFTFSRLQ